MKKNYLFIAMMCFCTSLWIHATVPEDGNSDSGQTAVKKALGFLVSDYTLPTGLYSFGINDATLLTIIKETPKVSAGACVKGVYYGATYDGTDPLNWSSFDLKTGEEVILNSLNGTKKYTDMSYDYSTDKLYAISHPDANSTRISVVNPADGSGEAILETDKQLTTLACCYDGVLYSIDTSGILYSINKVTKQITPVTDTGFKPNYVQSMEFDHETGILYWAACNDSYSYFFSIDVHTKQVNRITELGNGGDMTGLYIPFTLAQPDAPEAVGDFSVEAVTGKNAIQAKFSLPAATATGNTLSTIQSLQVECDRKPLKTYLNGTDFTFVAGKEMSLEVEVPAGLHSFRIYATNEAGNGVPKERRLFIGKDVPAAPENIVMEASGSKVKLKWNPVTFGENGGEIDLASLGYTVIRHPDKKSIAVNIKGNSLEDEVPVRDMYSYEITAQTAQGNSVSAQSEWLAAGEACNIPFSYNFDDKTKFKLWTVIDNNQDEKTWQLSKTFELTPTAMYSYSSENDGDDWMFTPPLKLENTRFYKLKFTCGVQNPRYPERLKVTMGRTNTVEGQTIELGIYDLTEYGLNPKILYLPENLESGNWYIAFQACSDKNQSKLFVSNVEVVENTAATFQGTVLANGKPVPGATVGLGNPETTCETDAEGHFLIHEIVAGTYTVNVSCFGYEDFSEEVTFSVLEKKIKTITLSEIRKAEVCGKVKTETGESIPDATVYLHGYANYTAQTDKEGSFTLADVYCKGDYKLEGYALNYDIARLDIPAFTQDVSTEDLILKEKLLSPSHFTAAASDIAVDLSWDRPQDKILQFRYDDGEPPLYVLNMQLGATANAVSGCIYDTPTVFTGMSWQVANNSDPKTTVDIIILDLDENGRPTKNVLFAQQGVASRDSYWSSFRFPHPIVAPRGALIGLQGDAFLCMDFGTSQEWPVQEGKSCYTFDYINHDFTNVDGSNLLVRAEGLQLGAPHQDEQMVKAPMPQPGYLVWRMKEEDAANPEKWTALTDQPVTVTSFKDETWKDMPKGIYRYAVKAVYAHGELSYPAITEIVPRLLTARLSFSLTTNTPETAEGAVLTLLNKDEIHSYTAIANTEGKITVSGVWEGDYRVLIEKSGFTLLDLAIRVEGGKDMEKEYILQEDAKAPSNLKINENGVLGSRLFRWNVTDKWQDDFEEHEDFAINSPGKTGWSYIDGDGSSTYASSSYEFPHMKEPMAFIVFNPSATTPSMLEEMEPHNGDKLLCCFAGTEGIPNNDYIISPELEMDEDFIIRFWASSYHRRFLEEIRIGYSTTGKEEKDFIWIGDSQTVPAAWTEYIINIPKEARYVTINCISNDCYILMLDEIYIGTSPESKAVEKRNRVAGQPTTFEVYLDGKLVQETTETSYNFTNLTKGKHMAGVKAVYTSGTTEMSVIPFNVEEDVTNNEEDIAPNGFLLSPLPVSDVLHIDGMYDKAELLNSSGQVILHTDYTPVISMRPYPSGLYYLKLIKSGKVTVMKVPVK